MNIIFNHKLKKYVDGMKFSGEVLPTNLILKNSADKQIYKEFFK